MIVNQTRGSQSAPRTGLFAGLALWALSIGCPVSAFAMTGPIVDKAADILAIVVLIAVPIGGVYLFWMVHVLPEKVAEKRHHPQKEAIKVLGLLSLVFGGMLWPFAWIWAYSRPTLHKLAYGTDKHEDYYKEAGDGDDEEPAERGKAGNESPPARPAPRTGAD
jgi:hypothetical protein